MKNKIIEKVIEIVMSSQRSMPAHLCSNGERTQSFCIDFEPLSAEDDYQMASTSFISIGDYMKDISNEDFSYIIRMGEDTMLASFIIVKLGHPELIIDTISTIHLYLSKLIGNEFSRIMNIPGVTNYLEFCRKYGAELAVAS